MTITGLGTRQCRSGRALRTAAGLLAVGVVLGLASTQSIRAQSQPVPDSQKGAGGKMEFEVASVHPAKPGTFLPPSFALDDGDTFSFGNPHGRFFADFPLSVYIQFAYKIWLTPEQAHSMVANLPKWVATDSFVIEARAPDGTNKEQMRLMLQSLLADRFKVAVHFENQEASVFALVLDKPGKTGPQLHPHSEGPGCDVGVPQLNAGLPEKVPDIFPISCGTFQLKPSSNGTWLLGSRNSTMQLIADSFPSLGNLGRPVVDETGLSGNFDFTLNFARESNEATSPRHGAHNRKYRNPRSRKRCKSNWD